MAMVACSGRRNFSNENDRLRRELLETRKQLDKAEARAEELRAKLSEAEYAASLENDSDALQALPRCAGVEIGRYSGPVDTDADRQPDAIEVYIEPYDGRRRFVQIAGRLLVEASALPPLAGGAQRDAAEARGRRLGLAALSPSEVREAYRAGPFGAHYTVRIPIPDAAAPLENDVLLRVELFDGVTGLVHEAREVVSPRPSPRR